MFKKHQTISSIRYPFKKHLVIGKSPLGKLILLNKEGTEFICNTKLTHYENSDINKEDYPDAWKRYLSDLKRERDKRNEIKSTRRFSYE